MRPRQTPITDARINRELNSPESEKLRRELSDMARNIDSQVRGGEEPEEDLLPPGMGNRQTEEDNPLRRGPISNRDKDRRIKQARIPAPRLDRQAFNPDIEPGDESEDEDLGPITNRDLSPITNRDPRIAQGGITNPPAIPEVDLLKKRLDEAQSRIEELERGRDKPVETKNPKPPLNLAARRKKYNAKYVPIIPASKGVFYNFPIDSLRVKRIGVEEQRQITTAKTIGDISMLIDAVGATLEEPIDIRDLTNEDWFHLLYHHLFNSYPKSSFTLNWTSKYGNENAYKIKDSDISYINPGISREEYQSEFLSKGICVPTLREWELLNTDNGLNDEDKDILIRAQWYVGDSVEEKVDNYFKHGETLDHTYLVDELKARSVHGVRNTVDVIDAKYDQAVYTGERRKYLENLEFEAERYKDNAPLYSVYQAEIDEVSAEVSDLEEKLKNGEQVRAEVETRPVRFNALGIFPVL